MDKKINILLLFLIGIGIAQGAQSHNSYPTILERDGDEPEQKGESKPKRDLTCQHCGKRFNFPSHLERHIRIHTGEKPYPCFFLGCDKAFRQSNDRLKHMQTHTGEKPFDCNVCKKLFAHKVSLTRHLKNHHAADNIENSDTDLPNSLLDCSKNPPELVFFKN